MKKRRNSTIDFLRGLAVFLMIVIHATAYFLSNTTARIVWDYTHIAVPLFVFCSAYIYFQRGAYPFNVEKIFKRIKRLVIPYYLYLLAIFGLLLIIDPSSLSIHGVVRKLLLFQGRDLNWLVVLFLIFIPLFSFLGYLYKKYRALFGVYAIISLASSIFLLTNSFNIPFRHVMWLPWSVYLIFTLYYAIKRPRVRAVIVLLVLSLIAYLGSRAILLNKAHTLTFTENKYPPNIFYLSYGIFWTVALFELHARLDRQNLIPEIIQRGFNFMSKHSYSLFFIHFWYSTIIRKLIDYQKLEWWGFFGTIFGLSIITQAVINKIKHIL